MVCNVQRSGLCTFWHWTLLTLNISLYTVINRFRQSVPQHMQVPGLQGQAAVRHTEKYQGSVAEFLFPLSIVVLGQNDIAMSIWCNAIIIICGTLTHDSEVIKFSRCMFFVCLSHCLSTLFNYEGLVPHSHRLQVYRWGCVVVQVSCTYDVIYDVTRSKSRSILPLPEIGQVLLYSMETNVIILGSQSIFMILVSVSVGHITKRLKIEIVCMNFQNPCSVHDTFKMTSDMTTTWQIM